MDEHTGSEYLNKLYSLYNEPVTITTVVQVDEPEDMGLTDTQLCNLKRNTLQGITKRLCGQVIPTDPGCQHEIQPTVDKAVDKYFATKGGKLLQYFNDTKNVVTDIIREAIEDELGKGEPPSEEDDAFITTVVDRVSDDEDVDEVIKHVENDIRQSAENDIKDIINDIKDDSSDENAQDNGMENSEPAANIPPAGVDPTADAQVNESVFHHYLIQTYKENAMPDDPDAMMIVPMVETALHYVKRILFNDGFARQMQEEA